MTTMPKRGALLTALVASWSARAGLFHDRWIPSDRSCLDRGAAASEALRTCRSANSYRTQTGDLKPMWPAVERCMADAGWTEVSRQEWLDWREICGEPVVARARNPLRRRSKRRRTTAGPDPEAVASTDRSPPIEAAGPDPEAVASTDRSPPTDAVAPER